MGRKKDKKRACEQQPVLPGFVADESVRLLRYHSGQNNNKKRDNVMPDDRSEDGFWNDDYAVHSARAREQLRNFAMLSWMVDTHLNFVSLFDIQFKTGVDSLDDWLQELFEWWSQAENFDVGKRYSLFQYLRVNEAQKVLNGDFGTLKFADGRVMGIDADRIDNGYGRHDENWFRGVYVHTKTMEPLTYRVLQRNLNDGSINNKFIDVPASNFYLHAERKHYPNLIRGISPLSNSINSIQDCYEGIDWHLVKMKVAAMLGVATFESKNRLPQMRVNPHTGDPVSDDPNKRKYDVKLGAGIAAVSMDVGEDIKIIESKIPSSESQEFYKAVTLIALKSLNIPYSFYSEDFTNFYGSRGALMHYIRSCEAPRQANIEFLNHHLKWRITKWITDGYIKLPRGYDVQKIRWQCVPRGFPFWDPSKEINGVIQAINAGLMTPQEACMQTGTNFYENVEQLKEARDWADKIGVPISWETQSQATQYPAKDDAKE
jgi:capsid protein